MALGLVSSLQAVEPGLMSTMFDIVGVDLAASAARAIPAVVAEVTGDAPAATAPTVAQPKQFTM